MKERLKKLIGNSFLSHHGFRRYFANTSWLMAEQVLRMTAGLFVGVYVARYLGPERFGVLSYAVSIVALFSVFSTLGLDSIAVRDLIKFPEKQNELLGTVFVLKFVGSVLVFALFALTVFFADTKGTDQSLILIIAAGLIFQSFNVIRFYFEANVLAKFVATAQITAFLLTSIAKLAFIWMKLPLVYFGIPVLLDGAIVSIGLLVIYHHSGFSVLQWSFSLEKVTGLLKNCWPLILSGIAVTLYMKIDQVMIRHMLDAEAVGQYAAAVRLSEVWYFLPMVICSSLFPAIVNAKKQSEELYQQRLRRLYRLMAWGAIAIALPVTFSSKWIINLLYGGQYYQASAVLTIHIWAGLFVFLGVASGKYLATENYIKIGALRTFVGCAANLALNFTLIPRYGIYGAAIATVVSYFIATFFIIFIPRTHAQAISMLKAVFLYSRRTVTEKLQHSHVYKKCSGNMTKNATRN